MIRYLSIITLVLSNFGYFGNFTEIACQRYYLISPVFKGWSLRPWILQNLIIYRIDFSATNNGLSRHPWTKVS